VIFSYFLLCSVVSSNAGVEAFLSKCDNIICQHNSGIVFIIER